MGEMIITECSESRRNSKNLTNNILFAKQLDDKKCEEDTSKDVESGEPTKVDDAADFEEAIAAAGYGKFNILLLLCALPGFATAVYVTTALSYVLTSAECDLQMDMVDMGRLNIITYSGMMASAMLWGFLSDTLGRKKIMVWGFIAVAICELVSALSQVYWALLATKFLSGFIFNGPFAVMISYISELHGASVRAKVLIYIGAFYSIGNMNLPLIAWSIIPNDWSIPLFGGYYVLHSWHIFLAMFSLPPLASGMAMFLLPESPKFLMSRGRNEEAMLVFRKIFALNTGLSPDEYPIKRLVEERSEGVGTTDGNEAPRGWAAVLGGGSQLRPLIRPPHLARLILICSIFGGTMLGGNTLRLWFPQIATIIEDYNANHAETSTLCGIITNHVSNKTLPDSEVDEFDLGCTILETGPETYINSVIIGAGTLVAYLGGGVAISWLGKRRLCSLSLLMSFACAAALYWATSFPETVALFTVFVSATGLAGSVLSSVAVDIFPTSMRAMAVAILLMTGRMGTVTGGMIFPQLLGLGCLAPFIFIALIILTCGCLCLALPRTNMKKLE